MKPFRLIVRLGLVGAVLFALNACEKKETTHIHITQESQPSSDTDTNSSNSIISLTLTTPQTKFVRTKDPVSRKYTFVYVPLKVVAQYADGKEEEITDRVTWSEVPQTHGRFFEDGSFALYAEGDVTLQARYGNIQSNPITLHVINAENTGNYIDYTIYNTNSLRFPGRGAGIEIALLKEPTQDVYLPLRLDANETLFFESTRSQTKTLHFKAGKGWDIPQAVTIIDADLNGTKPYTVYTAMPLKATILPMRVSTRKIYASFLKPVSHS